MDGKSRDFDSQDDEIILDMSDLFANLLRHWKSILIMGLVSALLMGGVSYYKSLISLQKDAVNQEENTSNLSKKEAQGNLTAAQIGNVEQLFYQYLSANNNLDLEKDYFANSIAFNMDPSKVVQYQIEYSYSSYNPDIRSSFSAQTMTEDDYKAVAEIMGKEDSYLYAHELIWFEDGSDLSDSDRTISIQETDSDDRYRGVFYVNILAESKEEVSTNSEIVRKAVKRHASEILNSGIALTLHDLGGQYVTTNNSQVIHYPDFVGDSLNQLNSKLNGLSEEEEIYYNYLLKKIQKSRGTYVMKDTTAHDTLKSFIIGLFGGWIVMVIIWCIAYVVSGTVKTADDLAVINDGTAVLGVLRRTPSYRGLGRNILRQADKLSCHNNSYELSAQAPLISERIARFAANAGKEKVFVILDSCAEEDRELLNLVIKSEELQKLSIEIGNPVADHDFLKSMDENSVCVLTGKLRVSNKDNLRNLGVICRETGAQMVGSIAII
ncbi:MAG: hypothetical protein PUJ06_01210 [Stecheria intestinalis]|nr:hypothetical protein [Stecheria intestinalis]